MSIQVAKFGVYSLNNGIFKNLKVGYEKIATEAILKTNRNSDNIKYRVT